MRKILIVNTVFEGGGAAKMARTLFLYSKNVETYFAYGRGNTMMHPRTLKIGNKFEFYLNIFFVRFLSIDSLGLYFSTKKLIDYIEKNTFDVVHLHNLHGYYVDYIKLLTYLQSKDIPVVWTLHDEWILTGMRAHSYNCKHCISGKGSCDNKFTYPKNYCNFFGKWTFKRKQKAIKNMSNLLVVSSAKWLSNKVIQFYPDFKIKHIPNGIDTYLFRPRSKNEIRKKYGIPTNKKIVLFSSTNLEDKNKGCQYVLDAAIDLQNENFFFIFLGKGKLNVLPNILHLGYVKEENVIAEIYSSVDIYCFFSHVETTPLSLIEAMSSNLTIYASDIIAHREVLRNYAKANLINFGHIHLLSDYLKKDRSNSRQENITKNYAQISTSIFSISEYCSSYVSLYNQY